MSNYTKVNRVLVGDGANSGTLTSLSQIQKGDLVLLDSDGNILTATTAAALPQSSTVFVAMGTGPGKYIKSQGIEGKTMDSVEDVKYDAPVQKEVALGYNGTSGTFTVTPGEEYRLRIHIKDSHRPNCQRPTIADANYIVPAGGSAIDAALALQSIITASDSGTKAFVDGKVEVKVISDGTTGSAVTGLVLNKGSKEVFKASHGLAAGSYIQIDGATYKVAKVFGSDVFILNAAFQSASGSYSGTPLTGISSVGFLIKGIEQVGFKGLDDYETVNFSAVLTGADDYDSAQYVAPSTDLGVYNPGQGYWRQVFDSEVGSRGYLGAPMDRVSYDAKLVESNVVEGTGYGSIVISHYSVHMADFAYRQHSPLQTEIYIPDGGDQGDAGTATNFIAILSAYVEKFGFDPIDLA
jgi:hypothetical protein